jgi:two-component sensor histidine kinase
MPHLDQRIGQALLAGRDDEGVVAVEDGRVVICTGCAGALLRCDPAKAVGATVDAFVAGLDGELLRLHLHSLLREGSSGEFVAPRPGARDEWIEVRNLPLSPGTALLVKDVTARELSDRTLRMLVNELNHRVKNMLATVQSLARQSLGRQAEGGAARDFEDRLTALAWTYDLLTREHWSGAALREVIERTLAPHAGRDADRLDLDGPDLWLAPNRVLVFALAMHELATNAVKYGALSNDVGRISVRWRLRPTPDPASLVLDWRERGGPAVKAPRRRGFGSRLIERALARELGGEVKLAFEADGLRCRMTAPLEEGSAAISARPAAVR